LAPHFGERLLRSQLSPVGDHVYELLQFQHLYGDELGGFFHELYETHRAWVCIPTKKIKIPLENNHGFRLKTITFPLEKDHVLFSGRKTGFQSFKRVWRFE
jgi:hypothetical protein